MTLSVDATSIKIKNNLGVVKFNSNDKLVYLKHLTTGTISIDRTSIKIPFQALGANDFLYLTIKFNSSSGNTVGPLLGTFIPANGSIVTNFYGRGVSTLPAGDTDVLCADIIGSNLVIQGYKIDYQRNPVATTITNNITYMARIYSYL